MAAGHEDEAQDAPGRETHTDVFFETRHRNPILSPDHLIAFGMGGF